MATYFKYAERQAENQIDWSEIGKNLSDTLNEQQKLREEKKAALDEATRVTTDELANSPKGLDEQQNQKIARFTDDMTKYMMTQERLLKSGALDIRDYTRNRNQVNSSIENAFTLSKEFQEYRAKVIERMNSTDPAKRSQALEQYQGELAEGFANMTDSEYYIDPTTGAVSIARTERKVIDGKEVVTMSSDKANLNDLRTAMRQQYNYFDVTSAGGKIAGTMGSQIDAIRQRGGQFSAGVITSIKDPRLKKDLNLTPEQQKTANLFEEDLNNRIDSLLAIDYNTTSILSEELGLKPTVNPNEVGPNTFLVENKNGLLVPVKNADWEAKRQKAYDVVRNNVLMQLEVEKKLDTYSEPFNYIAPKDEGDGDDIQRRQEAANMMKQLWGGTQSEQVAAATYFRDYLNGQEGQPEVVQVKKYNNEIQIHQRVPGSKTKINIISIPLTQGGQRMDFFNFAKAASPKLAGLGNIFEGLDAAQYQGNIPFSYTGAEGISTPFTKSYIPRTNALGSKSGSSTSTSKAPR